MNTKQLEPVEVVQDKGAWPDYIGVQSVRLSGEAGSAVMILAFDKKEQTREFYNRVHEEKLVSSAQRFESNPLTLRLTSAEDDLPSIVNFIKDGRYMYMPPIAYEKLMGFLRQAKVAPVIGVSIDDVD